MASTFIGRKRHRGYNREGVNPRGALRAHRFVERAPVVKQIRLSTVN